MGRENNEDGFGCCARLIVDLIDKSLKNLNESSEIIEYKLLAVVRLFFNSFEKKYPQTISLFKGICLSGGGCKSIHDRVIDSMKKFNIKYEIYVGNDSLSSMFTAFNNGNIQ